MSAKNADPTKPIPDHVEDRRLIDLRGLASILGVHVVTARKWIAEGRIPPPIRLAGRSLRWRVATIDKFLDSLETPRADDVA
jgi:predicted DNA-binding transcriptional regulator AlpA